MKRSGFTMIELIFVIVILGILAAVAIPKLAATRDDAKIASEMTSLKQALQNLGSEFTAQGAFRNYLISDANASVRCFTITRTNTNDGNVTVTPYSGTLATTADGNGSCPAAMLQAVTNRALASGEINATGLKIYTFGGVSIVN